MDSQLPQGRQPLLHEAVAALRAPSQLWSARDGSMGASPIEGAYVSDVRVLGALRLTVDGEPGEHLATLPEDASTVRFLSLHRRLDGPGADPEVRGELSRRARGDGAEHRFELRSRRAVELATELVVELRAELTPLEEIKAGLAGRREPVHPRADGEGVRWAGESVTARLSAPGAAIELDGDSIRLVWPLLVPAHGSAAVSWDLRAEDADAVVRPATGPAPWRRPELDGADDRLVRWVERALDDLDALRLESVRAPGEFLAAGAPWFFTLFGRDAIWAARLLLPLGPGLAGGTLRVLAALQGERSDPATAEQPGKIMHELRRGALSLPGEGIRLPPLYYGTVDATPLWVCLLADAREAGLPEAEARALLPQLEAALAWMRDHGDSDGDGLLEYVDETGHGLSNQGWKDSGDSVQWRDGRLAEGPIALCEVQAYAYEAATRGAALLEELRGPGAGAPWLAWAERLARAFRERFWIDDPAGAYPAIALDAAKRPVDSVTSNLGHLLGTGLLSAEESALVARRLVSPELASGFGLRTLSTDSAGYWPLSYHGGSVWAHDTAIAVRGLAAEGFAREAAQLAEGLLRAAAAFDSRMPELHGGDSADEVPAPVPYPAACRPQAWSAAAAITVLAALRP